MTLQDQIRQRWGQFGDWQAAGQDQVDALAQLFRANGVTDLDQLAITARDYTRDLPGGMRSTTGDATQEYWEDPSTVKGRTYDLTYGGKSLGFLGDVNDDGSLTPYQAQKWDALTRNPDGTTTDAGGAWHPGMLRSNDSVQNLLGWSANGHGNTSFGIFDGPDGKPIVAPVWGSSSQQTYDDIRGIASILALAAGGYYSGAGGTAGSVANGALQGYGTAVAGNMLANPDGDVNSLVKSSLAGAATGAVSGGIKAYGAEQGWSNATTKAVQGGANAALRGGDGGDILKGAVTAGAQNYLGGAVNGALNSGSGADLSTNQGADLGGKTMDFNFDPNYDYSGGGTNFNLGGWNADGVDNGQFDFSKYTLSDLNSPYEFNAGTDWKGLGNLAFKMLDAASGGNNSGALLASLLGAGLGAAGGKSQQVTTTHEPWDPMQPYLKGIASEGADLYAHYKAHPFSQAQQAGYGNVGGLLDAMNQSAPGLLAAMQQTAGGGSQFVRGRQNSVPTYGMSWNFTPQAFGNFGTRR